MPEDPDFISAKQAADFLFTTENSLRSMRSLGLGPPFHKCGHRVFYRRSELGAYIAALRPCDLTQLSKRRALSQKERGALAD